MIGQQVVYHEHIVTTGSGQTQILFLDESTMTMAPIPTSQSTSSFTTRTPGKASWR